MLYQVHVKLILVRCAVGKALKARENLGWGSWSGGKDRVLVWVTVIVLSIAGRFKNELILILVSVGMMIEYYYYGI
jgi:hypothetical protein